MRDWKRLLMLIVAMGLLLLARPAATVHAAAVPADNSAAYAANRLIDYGIPKAVVQVIIDNSRYPDGRTAKEAGATPDDFTVGNVAALETVSLATVVRSGEGASTSTPNKTVGDWIAGAKQLTSLAEQENYSYYLTNYELNAAGNVDAATGSLVTKKFADYASASPAVNLLFQIIASAKAATRVNLNGVTAGITDSGTAQMILALLQTNRLPKLRSLVLANNHLGNLDQSWQLQQTLFNTSADQRVTELDLSNNQITSFPWGKAPAIAEHLTNLNLAGNELSKMTDMLNGWLQSVVDNNGVGDVKDAHWDVADWNTWNDLLPLLNVNTTGGPAAERRVG